MTKTWTIKVERIKNEEIMMAMTIMKMIITTEIMAIIIIKIIMRIKICHRIKMFYLNVKNANI